MSRLSEFFDSEEAKQFALKVEMFDLYYDVLLAAVAHLGASEDPISCYELEDRLAEDFEISDQKKLELLMESLVIPGQEYTSAHELEHLRLQCQSAAFEHFFQQYTRRVSQE